MSEAARENAEDILNDALAYLGGEHVVDDGMVRYGELTLTIASKEGKANTLLADHLFSPALLLAERIERGLIPVKGLRIVELGAGCALPSLLSATLPGHPSLIVVTDYPDVGILGNLEKNVERSQALIKEGCIVQCRGYEWGTDIQPLMRLLPADNDPPGYDVMILSDLLHFHDSHSVLVSSITSLLSRRSSSRVYVAAGKYTAPFVCDSFLRQAMEAGVNFVEGVTDTAEEQWLGTLEVSGLNKDQLAVRKRMCRWWVGRWAKFRP